jgi:hypothetical protein
MRSCECNACSKDGMIQNGANVSNIKK